MSPDPEARDGGIEREGMADTVQCEADEARVLRPGRNCWRLEEARRAAFLVDARSYFAALHDSLARARRRIRIIGWDIDSRLELVRPSSGERPAPLGEYLEALARERSDLEIEVLVWDFSVLFALERQWFTKHRFAPGMRRRVRFEQDSHHPLGASHHQKIVVVDDAVAFAGGLDLTRRRWDTPHHAPRDARRVDPGGTPYAPFHDVQMVVDGPAARALAGLAAERWRRGTGRSTEPVGEVDRDPWPAGVRPALRDVRVAVARTLPAYRGRREVREVERLHLDLIASAKRWIYCENQYLTSERISRALAEKLRDPDGPEIVLITAEETRGWLERATMDVLRARFLRRLRDADRRGRLRVLYPHVPDLTSGTLMVHAKVTIVDDRMLRVGSSNLSNRSMGLDSECDLAVEFPRARPAIAGLRNRLMAEHLGTAPEEVGRRIERSGSILETIDELAGDGRSLRPLDGSVAQSLERLVPVSATVDPERPIETVEFLRLYLSEERRRSRRQAVFRLAAALAVLGGLAAAWQWTPLGRWLGPDEIRRSMARAAEHPLGPALVLLAFLVGGLLGIPVTALIAATGMIFGPWTGMLVSLGGSLLSAAGTFVIGRWAGDDFTRRFASSVVRRVDRWLSRGGVLAVAALRLVPVAPFAVVNLALGASSVSFRSYLLGTLAGMLPGIVALSWVGDRLAVALTSPDAFTVAVAAAVAAGAVAGLVLLRRLLRGRSRSGGAE